MEGLRITTITILGRRNVGKGELREHLRNLLNVAQHHQFKVVEPLPIPVENRNGDENEYSVQVHCIRGSDAIIFCYDINDKKSYDTAVAQFVDCRNKCEQYKIPEPIYFLIGTRYDLQLQGRLVEYNTADSFAREKGLLFMEVSSRNEYNIAALGNQIRSRFP